MQLKEHEIIDDLQRDGLRIIQNDQWFKFGIDAVLLSYFCQTKKARHIIDLGTGTGIIALLLSSVYQQAQITGLEYQAEVADMAQRSVALNQLQARIAIITGDIAHWHDYLKAESADVVVSNPPYFKADCGVKNPNQFKLIARHEVACTLRDLFIAAYGVLKPGGEFFMVHRPDRLVDIIETARAKRLEPKLIQFVQPTIDKPPNLVLIKCVKFGRPELVFRAPLVVYKQNGQFSDEVFNIYNQAHLTAFNQHKTNE